MQISVRPNMGENWVLLDSIPTTSGSSKTSTKSFSSYKTIMVRYRIKPATADAGFYMRFNGDAGAAEYITTQIINGVLSVAADTALFVSYSNIGQWNSGCVFINPNSNGIYQPVYGSACGHYNVGANDLVIFVAGAKKTGVTLSSIGFALNAGATFSDGNIEIYGLL